MYCRKCHEYELDGSLPKNMEQYVENIDPLIKTNVSVYEKRLEICENCSFLMNGMCRHCGCFVLVRAAKKNLRCPKPGEDCWEDAEVNNVTEEYVL